MTERELFLALLDLPDAAARSAFLDKACAGDAALRARVETLFQSHDAAGSFLGQPALPPAPPDPGATQDLGARSVSDDRADAEGSDLSFLAASTRPDSLGRIGHYEVLQVLGRGGFGIVFRRFRRGAPARGRDQGAGPGSIAATSPARKRFLREARSSAQVRHENVVQVYEVGEQPLPYLVMEFIPGETLQQRLDRTGPLEAPEIVRLGRQIAEGLAAAHATGLIHRDIKPANILIEGGRTAGQDHRFRPGPGGRRRQPDPERHVGRHADVHGPGAGQGRNARPPGRPVQPRQRAVCHGHRPAAVPRLDQLRRAEAGGGGRPTADPGGDSGGARVDVPDRRETARQRPGGALPECP